MPSDYDIDVGTLGGHYSVPIQTAVAQRNDDIDPVGFQPGSLRVDRRRFLQEFQLAGVGHGLKGKSCP